MVKQVANIFKTSGNILEIGSFIDAHGRKVDISERDIEELYSNLKNPIPFAIGHGENADIIGEAIEFDSDGSTIEHKGIITNSEAFKKYIIGKNKTAISPEVEYRKDNTGKVTGHISKLCFVDNPAILNNTTEVTTFKFSAPIITNNEIESITMPDEELQINQEKPDNGSQQSPIDYSKLVEAINNGVTKKFEDKISTLMSEIEKLKGEQSNPIKELMKEHEEKEDKEEIVEAKLGEVTTLKPINPISKDVFDEYTKSQVELAKKNEELDKLKKVADEVLNDKLNGLISDLKKYKFENPEKLLENLPIEDRIKTMEEMKKQIVSRSSMTSPTDIEMGGEGGKQGKKKQKTYIELCEEARFPYDKQSEEGREQIRRRAKAKGIPSGLSD